MHLKLLQKEQFKKEQKQLSIGLAVKLMIKLQKNKKLHHRIVQRQIEMKQNIMDLIVKYQKKDIYLQKKTKSYKS